MNGVHKLRKLRPLGRSEQLSAVSHELGFFQNVGLSAYYSLSKPVPDIHLQRIVYAALTNVIHEHGILSAIPVNEDSLEPYFARLPSIDLPRCVSFTTRERPMLQDEEDYELDKVLQYQHNTNFKTNYGSLPFWRLAILQDSNTELNFTASFIFYHGLGDGSAGLTFHRSFRKALEAVSSSTLMSTADVKAKIEVSDGRQLHPPLEQLHPLPINGNPANFRTEGLQEWTGAPIELPCISSYRSLYISSALSTKFAQKCKENGLTVTAGLQAIMAGALFDSLPSSVEALTGIIPINLRPWLDVPRNVADGIIGTFIDAIKVQIRRKDYGEHEQNTMCWLPAARHTSSSLQAYLNDNSSPSGEPYTSVAFFKAIPDVSVAFKSMIGTNRDAAFEVSNLGRFVDDDLTPSDPQWQVGRLTFSRSSVAFGAALTTSVVSGRDGTLAIGFSWQNGIMEDTIVFAIMEKVKEYFNAEAS